MLKFEDVLDKCKAEFDDEEAVATCVAGERIAYQIVETWDRLENILKEKS